MQDPACVPSAAGSWNPCSTARTFSAKTEFTGILAQVCVVRFTKAPGERQADIYCRTLFLLLPMSASANKVSCRAGCGACCTAPSITSPIPGMPNGKPAGVRCVQLTDTNGCAIFGHPSRPPFCAGLQASAEMCGPSREHAMRWLDELERETAPQA